MCALPEVTDTVRALLQSERVTFWGKEYDVTPELVPEIFGDGAQVIGLEPLNTRPNYYVVRVDSSWSTSNWGWDKPVLIDHLDDVYVAIEEYFGRAHPEECDCSCGSCIDDCGCGCGCDCWRHHHDWPALNDEVGSSWFHIAGRYPAGRYRQERIGNDIAYSEVTW